ncbi:MULTISPECIES: DUF645 family protein [Vibrio]|nr:MULTISPECIES: DUF645 family protein [Vibrio]
MDVPHGQLSFAKGSIIAEIALSLSEIR